MFGNAATRRGLPQLKSDIQVDYVVDHGSHLGPNHRMEVRTSSMCGMDNRLGTDIRVPLYI